MLSDYLNNLNSLLILQDFYFKIQLLKIKTKKMNSLEELTLKKN